MQEGLVHTSSSLRLSLFDFLLSSPALLGHPAPPPRGCNNLLCAAAFCAACVFFLSLALSIITDHQWVYIIPYRMKKYAEFFIIATCLRMVNFMKLNVTHIVNRILIFWICNYFSSHQKILHKIV